MNFAKFLGTHFYGAPLMAASGRTLELQIKSQTIMSWT